METEPAIFTPIPENADTGGESMQQRAGDNSIRYAALLAVLVAAAFYPLLTAEFINYDDPLYVLGNIHVRSGLNLDSIKWAFTSVEVYNWHPLTWLSHMLDVSLFGLNPTGHHLTSLLIHLANTILLFFLMNRMTGATGKSFLVAAFFAVHPLHVQSVAWIAERKDVLSTFFWLLTMLAYRRYVQRPGPATYLLCLLLFAFGLMSKAMVVTLPCVLLLMDFWPLGRITLPKGDGEERTTWPSLRTALIRLIMEKLPFLILALAVSAVTYMAQEKGDAIARISNSAWDNTANALVSYLMYIVKSFWPTGLSAFYPYDPARATVWMVLGSLSVLLTLTLISLWRLRQAPFAAVGWFWYLGTLVPVIGFMHIGEQAMADRYTYIPSIGLFILIIWGSDMLAKRLRLPNNATATAAAAVLIVFTLLANRQARLWQNSITLFDNALAVTSNNWLAHQNLATALVARGELSEALYHVNESLRIKPDPQVYVSQGWLNLQMGNYRQAVDSCRTSIAMLPSNDRAHFILGLAYLGLNEHKLAVAEYETLSTSGSLYASRLMDELNRPLPSGSTP